MGKELMPNMLQVKQVALWWQADSTYHLYPNTKLTAKDFCIADLEISNSKVLIFSAFIDDYKQFYVLKKRLASDDIGVNNNLQLYQSISQVQLAPQLIAFDSHFVCFEFVKGRTAIEALLTPDHKISLLSNLLHKFANISQSITISDRLAAKINPARLLLDLIEQCPQSVKFAPKAFNHWFKQTVNLDDNNLTLCHGDLNWGNVILENNEFKAIDWDYLCFAPLEYELAMIISINQLSEQQTSLLVAAMKFSNKAELINWLGICHLFNALWYLANNPQNSMVYKQQAHQFMQKARALIPLDNFILFNETKWL